MGQQFLEIYKDKELVFQNGWEAFSESVWGEELFFGETGCHSALSIADAVFEAAVSGRKNFSFKEHISDKELKEIGYFVEKKMSTFSIDKNKRKTVSGKISAIMQVLRKKGMVKRPGRYVCLSRKEKLTIVALEYIEAAQRHINEKGMVSSTVFFGDKYHLLYPDKGKYGGAVNFNAFSFFEIKREVVSMIGNKDKSLCRITLECLDDHIRHKSLVSDKKIKKALAAFSIQR